MKTITLSDMQQDDFDAAASAVASGVKAYNRKLDTREGTVLRDLLVNPEAAIEGVISSQIDEVRKSTSLKRMQEAQDAGESVDQEDIDAILSNFNITPSAGKASRGLIKIVVSDGSVAYSVAGGEVFNTVDGISFSVDEQVVAASVANPSVKKTTELYEGASGFFFLAAATAVETGASGNIAQGTALEPENGMSSFVMAEAYKEFCGGSDAQSVSEAIKSIPSGLSIRGFVNKTAVEGMLRNEFDEGRNPVVAVSSVGYGNSAQRRDKHNLFGVGVGGRVDVYVRNFTDFNTSTAMLKGHRVLMPDGTVNYTVDVPVGTFPGACWIKSVSDPFGTNVEENVLSSLAFEAQRTANVSDTWHDFDADNAAYEAFNTVWQGFSLTLVEVPSDIPADKSLSGEEEWSEERMFNVTAYTLPQAEELQAYVDRDDVRNVATDVVVRCPIICSVSVNALIRYDPKKPVDVASACAQIRSYINGLGFVGSLTRSEIVQILKNLGAVSVDMNAKDMLTGELHDANGVRHVLSGDALNVNDIANGASMLTKDTVVFCAEDFNIQIKTMPNE